MKIHEFNLGDTVYVVEYILAPMGWDEFKTDENGVEWKKVKPRGKMYYFIKGKVVARFLPTYTLDLAPGQDKKLIDIEWNESDIYYVKDDNGGLIHSYYGDEFDFSDNNRFFSTEADANAYIEKMKVN